MDFSEFCDTNVEKEFFDSSKKENIKTEENNFSKMKSNEKKQQEDVKEKISKYQDLSQNELMEELVKETRKQKENGGLDDDKLDQIKHTLNAILSPSEQKKLD